MPVKTNKTKKLDEAPQLSKQDWNGIFNTLTDMITIHDKDFNIIHANVAAQQNLQLPSLTGITAKCFKYYHGTGCPPEGCPSCECVKTGVPASFELFEPFLNKNIEIRAIPRFDNNGNIIGVIHICRDISKRKLNEEQIKNTTEELRKLTAHLQSVREEERKYIAREIHDELAQLLTALNMDLFWLQKKLPKKEKLIHEKTSSMLQVIDKVLQTVSRISSELRPGILDDLGLQDTMEWQADEFQKRTGIKCEVVFDTKNIIGQEHATTIFRIFQETLTNVVRHAKATKVAASLKENNNNLILKVKDNGKGITEAKMADPEAFGLIGIRERASFWKGKAKIIGIPDKGTTVTVSIPLNNEEKKDATSGA